MRILVAAGCAALGLLVGPFLAGLTVRVPARGALVAAGAWCGAPASTRRRVLVTVLAAVALGAVAAGLGAVAALPAYLWFAAVGVALGVIDTDCQLLPDRLTLPCYPAGVIMLGIASATGPGLAPFGRALLAAAGAFGGFGLCALISPASIGLGDVKLAGVLGLYLGWLGWGRLVLGLVGGFLLAALVAVTLLATRRAGWRSDVAFGPSLLAGALVAVAVGRPLLDAYNSASGLRLI